MAVVHVMLDLETMGNRPDAPILQIGLCAWAQAWKDYKEVCFDIRLDTAVAAGGRIDPGTVLYWLQHVSDTARKDIVTRQANAHDLASVLHYVRRFFEDLREYDVLVWGNGATFDNVLLSETFKRTGMQVPWQFRADMCYRTIKNLLPHIKPPAPPAGALQHNALCDARFQMEHLRLLLEEMKWAPAVVVTPPWGK